jgi:hypothetical protein
MPLLAELDLPLKALSRQGPAGLLSVLGARVNRVPAHAIAESLRRIRDPLIDLNSVAVVSSHLAVRVAVQVFAQAAIVFRSETQARLFADEDSARQWLNERLPPLP